MAAGEVNGGGLVSSPSVGRLGMGVEREREKHGGAGGRSEAWEWEQANVCPR